METLPNAQYSCLMSVYKSEKPANLKLAIESILDQTIPPSQFVIVKDGALTADLEEVLELFRGKYPNVFTFVCFEENHGLWKALQEGVLVCSNELIMRMDSDDFSLPQRAALQLEYMQTHEDCACCSSYVDEFEGSIENVVSHVVLPVESADIVAFAQRRNPMRHPAMMYRRSRVLEAGNYRKMPFFEDYDLVLRLIAHEGELYNLPEVLVCMRVDPGFYKRRGSLSYMRAMRSFRRNSLRSGYIRPFDYYASVIPHAIVCLLPNKVRECVYKKLLRK